MRKQIMKFSIPYNGTWKIVREEKEGCYNQFLVYYIKDGHQRLLNKYGDLESCLHFMVQQMTGHRWIQTEEKVERLI